MKKFLFFSMLFLVLISSCNNTNELNNSTVINTNDDNSNVIVLENNSTPKSYPQEYYSLSFPLFLPKEKKKISTKLFLGDKYSYNKKINSFPTLNDYFEGNQPTVIVDSLKSIGNINSRDYSSTNIVINNQKSIYKKIFTYDEMEKMEISEQMEGYNKEHKTISLFYSIDLNIDFNNINENESGLITILLGWQYKTKDDIKTPIIDSAMPNNPLPEEYNLVSGETFDFSYYCEKDGIYLVNKSETAREKYGDDFKTKKYLLTNCIYKSTPCAPDIPVDSKQKIDTKYASATYVDGCVGTETITIEDINECNRYSPEYYVNGTVKWQDRFVTSTFHNVNNITIELWGFENNNSWLIDSTLTNSNGHYSFIVPYFGIRENIFIKIKTIGGNIRVCDATNNIKEYTSSSVYGVTGGQNVNISYSGNINDASHFNEFLSIHQSLEICNRFIYQKEGYYLDTIDVIYDTSAGNSYAYYTNSSIHISKHYPYAWDILEHEYGHYISDMLNIMPSPTCSYNGTHYFSTNFIDLTNCKSCGIKYSWIEGIASFIMLLIQKDMEMSNLGIDYVGDTYFDWFDNTTGTHSSQDLELITNCYGEGCEGAVCAALYDLIDEMSAVDYDNVCIDADIIWNIIVDNECKSFSEFMNYFILSNFITHTEKLQFGSTLTNYRISGNISTNIEFVNGLPKISWQPQGGSSICPNNIFELIFYDENENTILSSSYITNSYYILSQSELDLLNTQNSTIYCILKVWQFSSSIHGDIITGSYFSNSIVFLI